MRWFRFPRTLGIVVCLYLLGMAAVFGMLSEQSLDFVHQAARTEGTVTELVARAPAGSTREPAAGTRTLSQAPKVSYVVNGTTYSYTAAHGRYHQRLKVGDRVQVLYDPSDPSVARLKGEGTVLVPGITVAFALAAALVALVLVRTRKVGSTPGRGGRRSVPAIPIDAGHPER